MASLDWKMAAEILAFHTVYINTAIFDLFIYLIFSIKASVKRQLYGYATKYWTIFNYKKVNEALFCSWEMNSASLKPHFQAAQSKTMQSFFWERLELESTFRSAYIVI